MQFDLGPQGLGILVVGSLIFGGIAQLVLGRGAAAGVCALWAGAWIGRRRRLGVRRVAAGRPRRRRPGRPRRLVRHAAPPPARPDGLLTAARAASGIQYEMRSRG